MRPDDEPLCQPLVCAPAQYFRPPAPASRGVCLLMLAMIEDAVDAVQKRPVTGPRRGGIEGQRRAARRWLMSDDCSHVFTFLRICEALSLPARDIRIAVVDGAAGLERRRHIVRRGTATLECTG